MKPARSRRLKIERHRIVSRDQWLALRAGDITASVVASLFGLHPRETPYGLFARLTGVKGLEPEDNALMEHGRELEPLVGKFFLRDHPGFKVTKSNVYVRAPLLRMGATPDFFVTDDKGRRGVMQAKSTTPSTFKSEWTDQTPPTWITLQCLTEMMLTRSEIGWVSVLIDTGWRFDRHHYFIPRHEAAERRLQDAVAQFWQDLDSGRAPAIDYERDGSLLPVLYPHAAPGKVMDLRGNNELPALLDEREALKDEIEKKIARKDAIETQLKYLIGDAEAAAVTGWRITNKEQHRKAYEVQATDFRVLRIAREKEKTTEAAA